MDTQATGSADRSQETPLDPSLDFRGGASAILRVEDMARIPNFYVDQFGFTSAPWGNDRTAIYLCQRDQGRGAAWAYVGVDDAKRACDEFVQTGIAMRRPPQNYTWAFGTHIEDPDGNVLRIGSDPLADQPFSDQPLGN